MTESDKSVLFLAEKVDAMILSSDKVVRNCAKRRSIEYHGMLWVFDKLVEHKLLSFSEAAEKLELLIRSNMIYQNNAESD
ncbi:hypothetical protein MASR2M69_06070 [Bacteroidota bacterium]